MKDDWMDIKRTFQDEKNSSKHNGAIEALEL